MGERDPEFLPEEWTLYGIGVAVILLRFAVRIKTVGFKGFQGDVGYPRNASFDDIPRSTSQSSSLMKPDGVEMSHPRTVGRGGLSTNADFVQGLHEHLDSCNVYHGTNVEASAAQKTRPLTSHEIKIFTFGSKEELAKFSISDQSSVGLWQHKYIKFVAVGCAASYVAVVLTITFGCFPTQKNWQVVPDPGLICTLKMQNFLVTVVLNVITDSAVNSPPLDICPQHVFDSFQILAIPVPLLWKLKIPIFRKLVIAALLCSGLFVITAAIIRVVLTLGSNPSALNINRWGVRETIVGIVTINLPIIKPLFNKSFWSPGSLRPGSFSHGTARNIKGSLGKGPYEISSKFGGQGNWDVEVGDIDGKLGSKSEESLERMGNMGSDSQELILQAGGSGKGVQVHTMYYVESEEVGWESDGRQSDLNGVRNKVSIRAKRPDE
ncbi:uncharacterized protein PAC_06887 [Phialocephala subalpina]|uniref:Rhodopsin domain-containing protein n=1 Tax=Phialocephala subalpina TaxID=576137 RepID=A0A1L7WW37_9HELO|nr:uncharacterized protein PAC_06887 [Phialocephala subalpina]